MNVSVSGLRDGVGPLLTVFLIQHAVLNPSRLSWVLAMPAIAGMWVQIPVGSLYDRVNDKRYVLAGGAGLMALSAVFLSQAPSFFWLMLLQGLVGLAACLLSVGIPALSLQVAKADGFGKRLARNEICSKIGNFGALGLAGFVSQKFAIHWIFGVAIGFALLVIVACVLAPAPAALAVRKISVVPDATANDKSLLPTKKFAWREAFQDAGFLRIVGICFLLQLTNAPLFMIFEQGYVPLHPATGAGNISLALILTQVVIIFGSLYLAKKRITSNAFSYFAIGFLLIAVRGAMFASGLNEWTLGAGQLLDGCIAAIIILLPMRAVAALDPKHFNLRSGAVGTAVGLGAALSMVTAGTLIASFGHATAALIFAGIAAVGLPLALLFMLIAKPTAEETKAEVASTADQLSEVSTRSALVSDSALPVATANSIA